MVAAVDGRVGLLLLKPSRRADMANEEHLEMLRLRVDAWNAWRESNPKVRPGFSMADLFRADLGGAHLREANLEVANLDGADLSGAILDQKAHLRRTAR
jgi:Pentapeptide repeats (8 copies)